MLIWKDEYSIGVDLIDTQHKYLFTLWNNTYDLLGNESCMNKYDKVFEMIDDLRQYARFHFQSEENYMLKIKYDQLFSQKIEHAEFMKKIEKMDYKLLDKNPKKYLEDWLGFILNWILDHVLHKDKLITSGNR
ncbi:bacteriohemerythrin [Inediibacterium massiliense]|uniref:bacteriohemerythrin n=1 Tax=Inediibacterium massiliense TaxID=1658111 RepID=UPI0006B4A25E|nr:hemerythrin family protein [Inediibacterium massiliense]